MGEKGTLRNVLVTGGWAHDFAASAPVLEELLRGAGVESVVVGSLGEAADELRRGGVDLLSVYACQFLMEDPRYDDTIRSEWARATRPDDRRVVEDWSERGGGVLALHTASICFDDWPGWRQVLGGSWDWGRSWHPAPGPLEVEPVSEHPVTAGTVPFTVVDERYSDLSVDDRVSVLLVSPGEGGPQPMLWAVERQGRVVYDALGHDERSLTHPAHARIIRRAARWAAGAPLDDPATPAS